MIKLKLKKAGTVVLSCVIVLMIALVAYLVFCSMSGKTAFIGKYAFVRIISPSMEPVIPTGEYILIKKVDPNTVQKNDVICFYSRDTLIFGKLNTHRVVDIVKSNGEKQFVTKGDNNSVNDTTTALASDVAGKYVKNLSFISKTAKVFNNKFGFFILVLIPAFLLLVLCIRDVVKKSHEAKMDYMVSRELERLQSEKPQQSSESSKYKPDDDNS